MAQNAASFSESLETKMPEFICPQCRCMTQKPLSAIGKANRLGVPIYCGRECAGIARQKGKTDEQKRQEKKAYDAEYRAKNFERLKAEKAEWNRKTYDPIKAAQYRKRIMPRHVEYCRRPEYRQWKRDYDQVYCAKKDFGEFWESALLAKNIRSECLSRMTDYEIRLEKGTLNKSNQRRRDYERTISKEPQVGTLGNIERHQRR
jgi:hypothetical protein